MQNSKAETTRAHRFELFRTWLVSRSETLSPSSVSRFVQQLKWATVTKKSYLIDLLTTLKRKGLDLSKKKEIVLLFKALELVLLRSPVKKAVILTDKQLDNLKSITTPQYAVPLALMVPTGARFADVARIRASDLTVAGNSTVYLKVFQTKSIRKRLHQRVIAVSVPETLMRHLVKRLKECHPSETIVQVSYDQFLKWLKSQLGRQVTTYSLRRSVFERMRLRARTIQDIQAVTLHFHAEQLRWYLEKPLPAEESLQLYMTGWNLN